MTEQVNKEVKQIESKDEQSRKVQLGNLGKNIKGKIDLKKVTAIPKKCEAILNKEFVDDTWEYSAAKNKNVEPRCWHCQKRFFWYWRHPCSRILCAMLIMILNFFIYAVDPVAESKREVELPIIGSMWSILAWDWNMKIGYFILRIFVCLVTFVGGPLIGWWFIHRIVLKRWLKLSMFGYYDKQERTKIKLENWANYRREVDEYKGSWFSMTITTIFWGYLCVTVYNAIAPSEYDVDDWLGLDEYLFGQMAVSLSWMGDSFTFFMILDSMFQEEKKYPNSWVERYGDFWVKTWNGYFRIVFVWFFFLIGSIIVVTKVWIQNDSHFEEWRMSTDYTTNEVERAFIGALIFGLDLAIVTQDWDFPEFRNSQEIMITGFSVLQVSFPPKCLEDKIPSNFYFQINGKWMNYSPMFAVMGLDVAAFIALAWYVPGEFAQYTGPDMKVWTVNDRTEADSLGEQFLLSEAYDLLNYTIRAGQCIEVSEGDCLDSSICNWVDSIGYCTYGNDIKLAGSYEDAGSLWFTSLPFVFFLGVLITSMIFLRKYQTNPDDDVKQEGLSVITLDNL